MDLDAFAKQVSREIEAIKTSINGGSPRAAAAGQDGVIADVLSRVEEVAASVESVSIEIEKVSRALAALDERVAGIEAHLSQVQIGRAHV